MLMLVNVWGRGVTRRGVRAFVGRERYVILLYVRSLFSLSLMIIIAQSLKFSVHFFKMFWLIKIARSMNFNLI